MGFDISLDSTLNFLSIFSNNVGVGFHKFKCSWAYIQEPLSKQPDPSYFKDYKQCPVPK